MTSARRYAREIEARWTELLERPVVLGERDWRLIGDWYAREIPLELVFEAMAALGEKLPRRRSRPRNLGALAPLVEEAWRTVVEGRIAEADDPGAGTVSPESWRRSAGALPQRDPLRRRVLALVTDLEAGAAAATCDAALDAELLDLLAPDLREELAREVEANLAGFRDRMAPETWSRTRDRALISSARRRLGLPRLGR